MSVRITLLVGALALGLSAWSQAGTTELEPPAFQKAIEEGKAVLVDVRTPAEFASGHIAGSVNIDWTGKDYEQAFAKLDLKKPVLLYCHGGGRSEQALEHLADKGYSVRHLDGGISAWKKAGLPVVK